MISNYKKIIYLLLCNFSCSAYDATVQSWVAENTDFLAYLARNPYPLSEWPEKYENGLQQLRDYGITNHSTNNYVFQVPGSTYWIKISGPKHRVRNLYTHNTGKNSYDYTQILKHWELRNAAMLNTFEVVPTYQTISRYANYLLRAEIIETQQLTHLKVPPTYLVHISGYSTHLGDEHYIVVQEHVTNIERLLDVPHRINQVSEAAFKQLYYFIRDTGFWNTRYGIWLDADNNFVIIDHEQRNIENPKTFFNKDVNAFQECVLNGLQELANVHVQPHDPEKYQLLLWLIATDTHLYNSSCYPDYTKLLRTG